MISGNGPAVSMWTMSSGAAARDVVRCDVGARMPFALEHPEHGASSPTGWMPCCCAVAFTTLEWVWARETLKWLISNTLLKVLFTNNPPGESPAAAILSFPLKTDSDSSRFPHATLEIFPPIPAPALLVL